MPTSRRSTRRARREGREKPPGPRRVETALTRSHANLDLHNPHVLLPHRRYVAV